ncbi:MAG: aldo/keto reductase [Frankiales bacterium]|nr:aldo/keto reductase [Frankiales bacterium]
MPVRDAPPSVEVMTTPLTLPSFCLGGNVFGWTSSEQESFAVLDAFHAAGGTFVDTADVYSAWVPGHTGGESEALLGRWMASRGTRDDMVVATKVASKPGREGLSAETVRAAAQESLERLQTDRIDLYYAHRDDEATPQEETCAAFDALVRDGAVRALGASNFSSERLASALAVQDRDGLARYTVVQPLYNLLDRDYERDLAPLVAAEGLACVPYSALASGFLSGKYRPGTPVDSARAPKASRYLERGGAAALEVLDGVAAAHGTSVPAVAIAWLAAQPTVASPIASARTPEQLTDLLPALDLVLTDEELTALTALA